MLVTKSQYSKICHEQEFYTQAPSTRSKNKQNLNHITIAITLKLQAATCQINGGQLDLRHLCFSV